MTIAAHIDTLIGNPSFLWQYLNRLASQNPLDHFIFFTQNDSLTAATSTANCTVVRVNPVIKNSLLLHYWYNYKLPPLLKKYNATVFINQNGVASLRADIPQMMIISDNFFLQKKYPVKNEYRSYLKRYFSKFITKASAVCVTKTFIAQQLFERYPDVKHKTTTLLAGLKEEYHVINETEKAAMLQKNTGGHEYFIAECSALTQPNMMALLKAFSLFKKRLKSGMQLVLLNDYGENPIKDFHLYKYRQEVQILPIVSEKNAAPILAAAYAGIFLPTFIITGDWGLHCLQSHVPLITLSQEDSGLLYEDAVLYTGIDEKMIAEKMMLLYKDEQLRNGYIQKGAELAGRYNGPNNSADLWQTILKCSSN
jgi:hypothetical protein